MKRVIMLLVIEGYFGWVRKDKFTLSQTVEHVKAQFEGDFEIIYKEMSSFWKGKRGIRRWVKKNLKLLQEKNIPQNEVIFLPIAKSMGVKRLWDYLQKYFKSQAQHFLKINAVFIDGHSPVTGYSEKKEWRWNHIWTPMKNRGMFSIFNIFQWNKKPKGASFPQCQWNRDISEYPVHHFSITQHHSVREMIRTAFVVNKEV
jgi:hypothetical protein